MRGPSIDDVLAVLWGVCGVAITAYFVVLGLQTRDMGASPVPLLVLAGLVLVGFSTVAVRHRRRAREARAARMSGPVGGWAAVRPRPGPTRPGPTRPGPTRPGPTRPGPTRSDPTRRPTGELPASGRAELARVVGIADRAGLFAPRAPRPVDLVEAVADAGEPVTLDVVLAAAMEAEQAGGEEHLRPLALHDARGEQSADALAEQVADLDRLTGDALTVRLLDVEQTGDGRAVRTRLRLLLGDDERTLDHRGDPRALQSDLHVAVAVALHAAVPDGPWLAWTWSDQGVWLAVLDPDAVGTLNHELGRALVDPWRWVHEQRPTAAGD